MDPLIASAGISALANLGGGVMSAFGAANANATNMAMNQQNLDFQNNVNNANWEHQQAQNLWNKQRMEQQNQFNWDAMQWSAAHNEHQALQQMLFQQNMSNTAYQRATADMRAAGLNPILAYQQGGASTPAGASGMASPASGSAPYGSASNNQAPQNKFEAVNTQSELGRALGRAAQSAVDAYKMGEEVKSMHKTREKLDQDIATGKAVQSNTDKDTEKKHEEAERARREQHLTDELAVRARADSINAMAGAEAHSAAAERSRAEADESRARKYGHDTRNWKEANIGTGTFSDWTNYGYRLGQNIRNEWRNSGFSTPSPFDIPYTGLRNDRRAGPRVIDNP